ncbi:putative bifunctional diguanylate cyclase/phosphodiesterase [Kineococcus sp. SYSU DK018]|uniref:putative bifunctional diguanylate cyclase/phosphodiesterase n=1 Tax=Kineococcus sp. SYSU DK018 TaxID=3383139 RepID=UPI003D7D3AF4
MTTSRAVWSARATWLLLAVVLTAAVLVQAVPAWRAPAVLVVPAASVLLIGVGVALHRPRGAAWWLVALMLAAWGAGACLGRFHPAPGVASGLLWAGQAVAAGIVLHVVRGRTGGRDPSPGGRLDLVVIAAVLTLVGAQLVAVVLADHDDVAGVLVASLDVALLGLLLRFAVSRRALPVSSWLLLTASLLTVLYDLTCALSGGRLAPPGHPVQSLGLVSLALFAVAALHPSMTAAFTAETFARRRSPSAALLGLLPLVTVPAALWWVAQARDVPGLPGWTVPVTGTLVAGLCLLRAAAALRASEHLAEHDPLTDLANRRGLARVHAERAAQEPCALLLLDLDDFKQVNDAHGHDVGDALLLQVSERLLAATGPDELVARLGGDEFVVLAAAARAGDVAERVLEQLRDPVVVGGLVLRTGGSVGAALPDAGPPGPLAEQLTRADVAMYAAKTSGGDRVATYHPAMREEVARRYALSTQVRRLLAGRAPDVGHLEVHHQPLVDLASGRVVGAEALVRWRHPEHGLLPPDAFLALVSTNDLDAQLDDVVLHEVVHQLARWRDQGRLELPVAVNLTRRSLEDPALAGRVLSLLADAGVPASQLHLEITEHQQVSEDGPAAASLAGLRAAGVEIHLDDYGTGYTSLGYLRRFPVQVLKLDRSVVSAVTGDGAQLVAGVQAMAAALDLQVVAEGVETPAQRARLVELGVRFGQGYLFSRPLPAREYAERVLGPARAHGPAAVGADPAPGFAPVR